MSRSAWSGTIEGERGITQLHKAYGTQALRDALWSIDEEDAMATAKKARKRTGRERKQDRARVAGGQDCEVRGLAPAILVNSAIRGTVVS